MVHAETRHRNYPPLYFRGGYKTILCPFDKAESNFVKVFADNGLTVTHSHIDDGIDFFDIDNLQQYDAIVSNPPFSKRQAVFEKLFQSGVPFAMITNMNGLFDCKSRWKLFNDNEFELLIPQGRMKFFNDTGVKNSPNFQSIYVCSKMLPKQIVFTERQEIK